MQPPRRPAPVRVLALLTTLLLFLVACTNDDPPADDAGDDEAAEEGEEGEAGDDDERGLRFEGPDEELVNAEALERLAFTVTADDADSLDSLVLTLDDEDVTSDARVEDTTLSYEPGDLDDGERTLRVSEGATTEAAAGDEEADPGATDEPEALHTWRFEVKAEPPNVELTSADGPVDSDEPVSIAGTTEAGATVAVGEVTTEAEDDGSFELEVNDAGDAVTIVVTDVAGNTTEVEHEFARVASRVEVDEVRAVHVTFWVWGDPDRRADLLQMVDDGLINAIQLDIKDESGHLAHDSEVEVAQQIGSGIGPLDLESAVAELHERDVAVVGRIVAFADPTLASWAWDNDHRDWVIQLPDGSDYYRGSYAGFSNYTHEDVIDYNLDIAEEAAAAGVDHILWDYIRRPEGIDSYTVPGLETSPEEAIVDFARQADERLAPYGVEHGASVYGIAADRPEQIGQDIPGMAEHLDYVAPMIYPSHWGVGEYGVADPNRQPYDIISATMDVWEETVEGTRARVVPWLEDTSYRAWDRPHQVREQIRAADERGGEWLMWNPSSSYTPSAYDPRD